MTPEVKAALERSHETNAIDCLDVYPLARAFIAEHPADDGEPIDEGWLRSIGGEISRSGLRMKDQVDCSISWLFIRKTHLNTPWRVNDDRFCMDLNNRGEFRLLLRALKIPTKETT